MLCSTTEDLLKWYNTFTAHPEVLGLSHDSLYNLTAATEPTGHLLNGLNASFAQGIGVTSNNNQTDKVRNVQSTNLQHAPANECGQHKSPISTVKPRSLVTCHVPS